MIDTRKYTTTDRGAKKWDELYKQCSTVERVNAYLKEYFGLNNVRQRTKKKTNLHFQIVTLVYHASRLATNRIRVKMEHLSEK